MERAKLATRYKIVLPGDEIQMFIFFFHCLFEIRNRIFPAGSTPKGGPTEITPTTQATRHPRALPHFLFPLLPYFCHASCIRSVPSPVLLSCTYNLSSLWSVLSLFSCPTHIFKPHRKESLNTNQTPHTNCVNSLFQ